MKNSETIKQIGNLKNSGEIGDICNTAQQKNYTDLIKIQDYDIPLQSC